MVSCFFFFFACIIHKYSIERTSGFSTAYCSFRPSCTIGCLVAHKPSRSQSQLPPAPLPASQTASTTGGGKHTHTHRHRDVGTNRTLNLFWVLIFRFKIVRFNGRPGRAIESSQAWSNRRTTGQTVSWPVGPPSSPHSPSCRCLYKSRCCKHIYLETAHTNFAIGIFRERKLFAFPQYNMGYSIK